MYWNYRIVQKSDSDFENNVSYSIHEIYYDENGNMESMTEQSVSFHTGSVKDLAKMMLEALEKPVVVWDEKLKNLLKQQKFKGILYEYETR